MIALSLLSKTLAFVLWPLSHLAAVAVWLIGLAIAGLSHWRGRAA